MREMFRHRTKTVTFATALLAASSLLSRVLGLVRDRLLAGRFGAGAELDIYFSAFRIPDFVYAILIVGGITAAFLPVFSDYFKKQDGHKNDEEWSDQALEFVNNLLNSLLVFLVIVCGILVIAAPVIAKFIVPGFSPEHRALAVALTRIMFLSPILFGLASIFSGILQYFDKFLVYSLCPILYNLGIIFGIIFLVPVFGTYGLALGVVLGAFLYFGIQIPAIMTSGFRYRWLFNFWHPGIKRIFKLTLPRIIGTASDQINLLILTAIASTLVSGSITIFNFSNGLQYFPVAIVGLSFAISSFPVFSRFLANGQKKEFLNNFSLTFRQIIYFIIPTALILFILHIPVSE